MSVQGATSSAAARRRWFLTVLVALMILAVAAGIALSRMKDANAGTGLGPGPSSSANTSVGAGLGSAPASAEPSESAPEPEASTHKPKTTSTRKVSTSTEPSTEASTGPVIEHFRVSSKPSCPSGTDQVQYEGQPVTLTWKTSGADKTTISVDGPGIYDTYDTDNSVTLNFPCGGDPGSYQTHTYLLTAYCPEGTTVTERLTVKAKVNEIATT